VFWRLIETRETPPTRWNKRQTEEGNQGARAYIGKYIITAMAPKSSNSASSTQAQKQRTISSFFNPKPASNSAPKPPAPTRPPSPPKRSLENSDEENEEPDLPVKRLRVSTKASQSQPEPEKEPEPEPKPQPSSSDRTSKYIFSNSPDQHPLPPRTKEKELLHQRFVKKLSRPDVVIGWSGDNVEEAAEGEEDDEDEEQATKQSKANGAGVRKLTPMEKQYLEIKRKHLDKVILYQVGYKYRFFGEDARIASKELGLVCIPGKYRFDEHQSEAHIDRFASASFPIARLHVHVKRLVAAGHKVGVVRQLETAALKAAGSNRNAPFVRELTNVYTQGTYIDEVDTGDDQASTTGYLVCLTETNVRSGDDEKVRVGMIATQPAIDSVIIYDDFEDGFMRTEIETRMLHLSPCEYLILGNVSSATRKLINHLCLSNGVKARVDYVKSNTLSEASSKVSSFFAGKMQVSGKRKDKEAAILERILKSPDNVTLCLDGMIDHLREFSLESVFKLTDFHSFSSRTHMLLNGNTLSSLEVYENQTDFTSKGSLFWSLDRTCTRFGKRMLRRWVGRPLLDKSKLEDRIRAVEELKDDERSSTHIKSVLHLAKGDLEKTLIRIYYKRANRPEILKFLQAMQKVGMHFTGSVPKFRSNVVKEAIADLPVLNVPVSEYLERISLQAAKDNDKYEFFTAEHESEDITEQKLGIEGVKFELESQKVDIAKTLGKKKIEYTTVSGTDFLVEVENSKAAMSKVPANWVKISNTKKCSRFRTPTVIKLLQTRDQHKESLEAACDEAFVKFQEEIVGKHYQMLRDAIQSLATLDCLESLAIVAAQPGYVKPEFSQDSEILIDQGRHPMVEQILLDTYVPNDIALHSRHEEADPVPQAEVSSALLVTGPNMGGKSSYVRSIALICIMAQLGSYVPCASARLGLMDAVFTRMGASDRLGASTFAVELSETSGILAQATTKSLVILDELGRGTSTHDGAAIAEAVLRELVDRGVMTLFITHYMDLARVAEEQIMQGRLTNVHMRFEETPSDEHAVSDSQITFLYEAAPGVAHRSYGLNVARLANVSVDILAVAREKSREMEEGIRRRKVANV
jgi:DNA mismatch repair protein MSH3